MRGWTGAVLLLSACANASAPPPVDAAAGDLARDTAAYAVASCFAALPDAFLRDQGSRWAGGIIQRAAGPIEAWTPIADAVKAELKRGGIGQGKPEGPTAPSVPLPVMTCGEIGETSGVAVAVEKARRVLAAAYRARGLE